MALYHVGWREGEPLCSTRQSRSIKCLFDTSSQICLHRGLSVRSNNPQVNGAPNKHQGGAPIPQIGRCQKVGVSRWLAPYLYRWRRSGQVTNFYQNFVSRLLLDYGPGPAIIPLVPDCRSSPKLHHSKTPTKLYWVIIKNTKENQFFPHFDWLRKSVA